MDHVQTLDIGKQLMGAKIGALKIKMTIGWRFRIRATIGLMLIRLGAWVMPFGLDVETEWQD